MNDAEVRELAHEVAIAGVSAGIRKIEGDPGPSAALWGGLEGTLTGEQWVLFLGSLCGAQAQVIGRLVRHLAEATGQKPLATWEKVAEELTFETLARRSGL